MAFDILALKKLAATKLGQYGWNGAKEWYARKRAAQKAIAGGDLTAKATLAALVATELERLARESSSASGSEAYKGWLKRRDTAKRISELLLARLGGSNQLESNQLDELAESYELDTGEAKKTALGSINLAVDYVCGQLQATDRGRAALQLALGATSAAAADAISKQLRPLPFPGDADLARGGALATSLLETGRITWAVPGLVAPLVLSILEPGDTSHSSEESQSKAAGLATICHLVRTGGNVMLFGEGGIGKTTFLLELAKFLLDGKDKRIPLYVDASLWARSNSDILDYIANGSAARLHEVTASELAKLAELGLVTILLNGWNEIPPAHKVDCLGRIGQLMAAAQRLNIVVVTRSRSDSPNLRNPTMVHAQGLTWQGQSAVIRAELETASAEGLIERLSQDNPLRYAARSPLILKGLIAQARKGEVASSSVYDLLGAAIDAFEGDGQRHLLLGEPPLRGFHRHFLEAIACKLTQGQDTTELRHFVLPVIADAGQRLRSKGHVETPPEPTDVLEALSRHHLLHIDEGVIRFAHQRFQEYFTASVLLRACESADNPDEPWLKEAANQPSWTDALILVCGKLGDVEGSPKGRINLVRTALAVDFGLACDLAGGCSLSECDDPGLYADLIAGVKKLCDSPLPAVSTYGTGCMIATRFIAFAGRLWSLLESEDMQLRLSTYRMNSDRILLSQLGNNAEHRISTWPVERRIEFMHEVARSPESYNFLLGIANSDAAQANERAAAILSLGWNFPASDAALQAWLAAPMDVQAEHGMLGVVEYALEQGVGGEDVRGRLKSLAVSGGTDSLKLLLARVYPDEFAATAMDAILARLGDTERGIVDDTLLQLAKKHAPDRLMELAKELVLSGRTAPTWACELVGNAPAETRAAIFESAWKQLQQAEKVTLNVEALGPLATREQTQRSVQAWLRHCEDRRGDLEHSERERGRELGHLLANAPGEDIMGVVTALGLDASYEVSSELLELVVTRIGRNGDSARQRVSWLPSTDNVRSLISSFLGKSAIPESVPQCKVPILLCYIASKVSPGEFEQLLLDVSLLYLDAWVKFNDIVTAWAERPSGPRPTNPYHGNYLIEALGNWGFGALKGLLELLDHPFASELVLPAMARIVRGPWALTDTSWQSGFGSDIRAGEQRRAVSRVLLQPDDSFQEVTDAVAQALASKLNTLVQQMQAEQTEAGAKWNCKQAAYRIQVWIGTLANIPSPVALSPVTQALAAGFSDVYGVVGALKALVRQGTYIEEPAVVRLMELVYAETGMEKWPHESTRYVMLELNQLFYYVRPSSLLGKPLSEYLVEWSRFSYPSEIVRSLGAIPGADSWNSLLSLARQESTHGRSSEELASALASVLTGETFTSFLGLVEDGSWFVLCGNPWAVERNANPVGRVIGDDASLLRAFLSACNARSSPMAECLACSVLKSLTRAEDARIEYGLAALDTGVVAHDYAHSMLLAEFQLQVPMGAAGQYEVHQKSSNPLRRKLYFRAKENHISASACRNLLAELECQRRENGRPTDEPRHPAPEDGACWTEAMTIGC
ncbi:hypothetical protein [Cupriavidus sp. BIC8F]|uniref:NACHT domain-containing protein n=1 Tax=Cupriavidus sp. BIC8F TaxID=3079014 RepID=UPI0029163184|nr:hypothetical protein [Cupriavidus sp. BIC8F]